MMAVMLVTLGAGLLAGALVALALGVRGRGQGQGAAPSDVGGPRRAGADSRVTLRSRAAALVTIVGLGAFGLILTMVQHRWGLADLDRGTERWAAEQASSGSTHVLRTLTQFGGSTVLVPIAVVVAGADLWRRHRLEVLPFLAAALGGQYLIVYLIKDSVDRPRPDLLRLTGFSGSSFPSGHATAAAAGFAALAVVVGPTMGRWGRSLLGGAAAGLAVSVAMTRVALGVHWLTDVLAGLCLGWAWFAACLIACRLARRSPCLLRAVPSRHPAPGSMAPGAMSPDTLR